jgi:hypothetical protein
VQCLSYIIVPGSESIPGPIEEAPNLSDPSGSFRNRMQRVIRIGNTPPRLKVG